MMNQYFYTQARSVKLVDYHDKYCKSLFLIMTDKKIQIFIAPDFNVPDFSKFKVRLERRIEHRWTNYKVAINTLTNEVVGFLYCYEANNNNRTTKLCCSFDVSSKGSLICFKTLFLYISHLFIDLNYRKIYAEVFAYNKVCLKLLDHCGFEIEGALKEHQFWNNQWWDELIFAFTYDNYSDFCSKNKELTRRVSCNKVIN